MIWWILSRSAGRRIVSEKFLPEIVSGWVELIKQEFLEDVLRCPWAGTISIELPIPPLNSLLGSHVNFQAGFLDPSATDGITLTNGVDAWIL